MTAADKIKTMQLYNHIDRVHNELKSMGISPDAKVDPVQLSEVDSLHYLGNAAIEAAIDAASISAQDRVLDIGSGLGGPARMLCHMTQCTVDAMELQQDLSTVATELTARCPQAIATAVHHVHGDFLSYDIPSNKYTKLVSWLVFLHIPDRTRLMTKCCAVLAPGGCLYVEDFYMKHPFTPEEQEILQRDVYVSSLPTWEDTKKDFNAFDLLVMDDMTDAWKTYVRERVTAYEANLERHVRIHGQDAAEALLHFYRAVDSLFQSGHLGGVRYCVKKPSSEA